VGTAAVAGAIIAPDTALASAAGTAAVPGVGTFPALAPAAGVGVSPPSAGHGYAYPAAAPGSGAGTTPGITLNVLPAAAPAGAVGVDPFAGSVVPPSGASPGVMLFSEGPHGSLTGINGNVLYTSANMTSMASYGFGSFIYHAGQFVNQAGSSTTDPSNPCFLYSATPNSSDPHYNQQFLYGAAGTPGSASQLAHAAGLQVYLYVYLAAIGTSGIAAQNLPPCADSWSDNAAWANWNTVAGTNLGGALAWMGFDGIILDTEVEGQNWADNGPGTTGNFGTTNTLVASRATAWVEALNAGAGFQVPIYAYQSLPQNAVMPGGYGQYYCAYLGNDTSSAVAFNTSLWTAFVYGMAQGTTAPIMLGDTLFYNSVNVWGSHGPYGTNNGTDISTMTTSWNEACNMDLNGIGGAGTYTYGANTFTLPGFNNQTVNLSGILTPMPDNVYMSPMLWVSDNTGGTYNTATTPASGIWTTAQYQAALPALETYAGYGTWALFQGASWCNYSDNVGTISGVVIPSPGYDYVPVNGTLGQGITNVQNSPASTVHSGTPITLTLPNLPIAGNYLTVVTGGGGSSPGVPPTFTVSGGGVGTWSYIADSNATAATMIAYGIVTGTPSETITVTVAAGNISEGQQSVASEWNGIVGVDTSESATGTSTTAAPGTLTPSESGDLFLVTYGNIDSFTGSPTGWTALGATEHSGIGAWYVNNSTTGLNPSAPINNSNAWAATMVAFKSSGVGAPIVQATAGTDQIELTWE